MVSLVNLVTLYSSLQSLPFKSIKKETMDQLKSLINLTIKLNVIILLSRYKSLKHKYSKKNKFEKFNYKIKCNYFIE